MPINRKYGVADIIEACKRFPVRKRSRITFEYVMLAGVNDSPVDARRLARLLAGVKAKVNLIPLNAAAGIPFERPSDSVVDEFARILAERDVTVSVQKESRPRHSRGLRPADRRRTAAVARSAARDARLQLAGASAPLAGRATGSTSNRTRGDGMSTVLVTGGSGFIGSHCVLQLLAAGHRVRTTVRSLSREADVRALLKQGGVEPGDRLAFAAADLEKDAGWAEAVSGCEYVLHVASPFPPTLPTHEDELIVPAREGALRVLRAARDAGVKRVVLTSSFAAIGYGQPPQDAPFDETSWTNAAAPDVQPYVKSKTLAERAAWAFIGREGGGLELSVVNPVGVFGPVLGPDFSTSILLIRRLMDGAMPGCPNMTFGDRRRARRRRPSPSRDDRPGRRGRTLPRRVGRLHVDRADGSGAESPPRTSSATGAYDSSCPTG